MLEQKISPQWKRLLSRLEGGNSPHLQSIQKQILISPCENTILPCETPDPLGADYHTVIKEQETKRLVHQYKNRCLFILTGKCFSHCRYCFRRESPALRLAFANDKEISELCDYVSQHNEVKEVLLTGGDPLTASDQRLRTVLTRLRTVRKNLVIRLATRAPIFAPERITDDFLAMVQTLMPIWIIPHVNHQVEISEEYSPETRLALQKIIRAGIPMQSQSVLFRGINNNIEDLVNLFNDLIVLGIKPGYLFQGDLAPGTSHLRVDLDEAIALFRELKIELSGLSCPNFTVDLPNGGGKVNLLNLTSEQYILLKSLY